MDKQILILIGACIIIYILQRFLDKSKEKENERLF